MIRVILFFLFLFPLAASAEIFNTPTSTALGGTGSASVNALESSHLNPATLPFVNGYYAGFLYGTSSHAIEDGGPSVSATNMGIAITDATGEAAVPASLTYSRGSTYIGNQSFDETELQIGFGFRVTSYLSAGFSGTRLTQARLNSSEREAYNASSGFLFTPNRNLGIALVFHDMLNTDKIEMTPVTTVGLTYAYKRVVRFLADWSQPQKSNPGRRDIVGFGLESIMGDDGFSFRTGGHWDQVEAKRYGSLGLGWKGPNLSFDYAYEKNLDMDDLRHLIDMHIQF